MKVSVQPVYTSAACNRMLEIVDWNEEGFICFGSCKAVVIYDTKIKGKDPLTVLCHHKNEVISVKWVRKPDGPCTELVSCSTDKTAAIWTLNDGVWGVSSSLTGHADGVTCVYGMYTDGDNMVVYTGSIDSQIKVWERYNGITTLKQTISLNCGLCLTLHAHLLPVINKPILFCALDDFKIHIFSGEDYHRVHTLVGHEDWVRGLDVLDVDSTTILLASASQDTYIRLWRIQQHVEQTVSGIKIEEKVFIAHKNQWSVKLDAVLAAHEGWVYGVQWHPYGIDKATNKKLPVYRLLTSSLDKTLIVWEPGDDGSWVERVRVGEVGGNGLGFYGSRFGPDGLSFLGHGYNGSFHIWKLDQEKNQWMPTVVCGGHFSSVEDVRWEPQGRYIMSVSDDQTTRLHAPWVRADGSDWHELARPQVHGYNMASLAILSATAFASAAEEKVIRVFRAPHNFVTNFRNITGETLEGETDAPEGASVPSLGLSNKAVFAGDENKPDVEDDSDGYFVPINLTAPPTEEALMQNTLWPEAQKLYGHGYEVFALAASQDGSLLASACKATAIEHAAVLIWETKNWHKIQKLESHTLTVTQLEFSPDSQRLLSVSRDRRWTLYERHSGKFSMVASTDKKNGVHSRIIWCCSWSHDGDMFATGSRDGKVCVWSKSDVPTETSLGQYGLHGKPLELSMSVTALAFAPVATRDGHVLATGTDCGLIRIYLYDGAWCMLRELDHSMAHHLTVKRLAFRPKTEENEGKMLLASCGHDGLVRIHSITTTL